MPQDCAERPGADILILGATGSVGGIVTRTLAGACPDQIYVGGRDSREVSSLARDLGHCAHPIQVDVRDPTDLRGALAGKSVVINASSVGFPTVLAAAIERGVHYVDITADQQAWSQMLTFHEEALKNGTRAVLGAGLVPGLSNVLMALAVREAGPSASVRTGVHLDVRDPHGPGALQYMLAAFDDEYALESESGLRKVSTFQKRSRFLFPGSTGSRRAYSFPFPGQFHYRQTLGVIAASTYLSLAPAPVADAAHLVVRAGVGPLLARLGLSRAVGAGQELVGRGFTRPRPFAIVTEATGVGGSSSWNVQGLGEGGVTALVATWFVRQVLEGQVAAGVHLPEQVCDPNALISFIEKTPGVVRIEHQSAQSSPQAKEPK